MLPGHHPVPARPARTTRRFSPRRNHVPPLAPFRPARRARRRSSRLDVTGSGSAVGDEGGVQTCPSTWRLEMTAELEAVVVAATSSLTDRSLAWRGPCDPPSANRCSMVSRIPNLARRRVAVHAPLRPASDSRLASAGDEDLRRGFLDPRPHPLPSLPGQGSLQSTRSRAPPWAPQPGYPWRLRTRAALPPDQ